MSVQSVCGEHMNYFCVWIYDESGVDKSDILTKNYECVLHRQIQHEFFFFLLLHTIHLMLILWILIGLHLELFCTAK